MSFWTRSTFVSDRLIPTGEGVGPGAVGNRMLVSQTGGPRVSAGHSNGGVNLTPDFGGRRLRPRH